MCSVQKKRKQASSFPNEAVLGVTGSMPQDVFRAHQELLKRVSSNQGLEIEVLEELVHSLIDILVTVVLSKVALPLNEVVVGPVRTLCLTLSFLSRTSKRGEKKYFVASKEYEYLYSHLLPGSLVIAADNERDRQGLQCTTPKAKDSKKLDVFGRKIYSTGGLQLCISNQQAFLRMYDYNAWNSRSKFKDPLHQESTDRNSLLRWWKGRLIARASLQAALDTDDMAARTMASAVVMQRYSWLQFSGLSLEVKQSMQDLPFERASLFSLLRTDGLKTPWP